MNRYIFLLVSLLVVGCTSAPIAIYQANEACNDPGSETCWNAANYIQAQLKNRFIYISDQEQYGMEEHWKSHWKELEAGQLSFMDDCDGFAFTGLDMGRAMGISKDRISLKSIEIKEDSHLVLKVGDFIVDNRQTFAEREVTWRQ